MGFQKGQPRPANAGRKPGSTNKRTTALQACERMGFDPFEAMVKLAMEGDSRMIVEICQYIEPKLRAMEVSGELNQELLQKAQEYEAMSKEELMTLIKNELANLT